VLDRNRDVSMVRLARGVDPDRLACRRDRAGKIVHRFGGLPRRSLAWSPLMPVDGLTAIGHNTSCGTLIPRSGPFRPRAICLLKAAFNMKHSLLMLILVAGIAACSGQTASMTSPIPAAPAATSPLASSDNAGAPDWWQHHGDCTIDRDAIPYTAFRKVKIVDKPDFVYGYYIFNDLDVNVSAKASGAPKVVVAPGDQAWQRADGTSRRIRLRAVKATSGAMYISAMFCEKPSPSPSPSRPPHGHE
jgi:hypothetical protein